MYTRERLSVGLEPIREGPRDAVLTGHLVSLGLVEKVDGPVPGALQQNPGGAYYALTHRGYEVARLFSPRDTRPQELGALDASPPATRSR